jgi:hypothetical protein
MKKSLAFVAVILFTLTPVTAAAQDADPSSAAQPPAQAGNGSFGQGIRNDAARAREEIRRTTREIRQGIKNGAAKLKRDLAVAQCNDGRYSYTHHGTCNHHGGVRQQFR